MIEHGEVPGADSLYVDAGGRRLHYLRAGPDRDRVGTDAGRPGDADGIAGATDGDADLAGGAAPPSVVLLHGSGIDDAALSWRHAIPALAANYRVYAPDLPGYGDSPDPDATPTAAYYTDVLRAFLDAVPVENPAIVGISMGGAAALGLAVAEPGRLRGLVLVDSYGLRDAVPGGTGAYLLANAPFAATLGRQLAGASPGGARAAIGPFVADPDALDPAFLEAVRERLADPGAGDAFVAFQRAEFRPGGVETHYAADLPELSVPTLFVHGEADPIVPLSWARTAAEAVPGADLAVIGDCGHWPPRECPEAFLDAVEPFLAGL